MQQSSDFTCEERLRRRSPSTVPVCCVVAHRTPALYWLAHRRTSFRCTGEGGTQNWERSLARPRDSTHLLPGQSHLRCAQPQAFQLEGVRFQCLLERQLVECVLKLLARVCFDSSGGARRKRSLQRVVSCCCLCSKGADVTQEKRPAGNSGRHRAGEGQLEVCPLFEPTLGAWAPAKLPTSGSGGIGRSAWVIRVLAQVLYDRSSLPPRRLRRPS